MKFLVEILTMFNIFRVGISECTVEEILCSIGHKSENVPCTTPYGTCLANAGIAIIGLLIW